MDRNTLEQLYDQRATKDGGNYEYRRWHKDPLREAQFEMMCDAISRHTMTFDECFGAYLELGPGPGTWTNVFVDRCPNASFTLVDISEEMLALARNNVQAEDISFIHSSAEQFTSDRQFDFFFSSRAVEYVDDKASVLENIISMLANGAHGVIVTKMPHYRRARLAGRDFSDLHRGQIAPRDLRSLLHEYGCTDISMYPATTNVPIFNSARLNMVCYQCVRNIPINPITAFFSESYIVTFTKP